MNILIIPSFIFSKKDPTLGSFVFEQALALEKCGHNVYILFCDTYSLKDSIEWLNYREENEVKQGVTIYRKKKLCILKHGGGFYGTQKAFSDGIQELYEKYLEGIRIDIIHAHCCIWAGCAAQNLSKKYQIPYVITEHSTVYALGKKKIKGQYERKIISSFQSASKVICVSEALKKLISPYVNNAIVVGNVIDTEMFNLKENNKENRFIFLSVCYMKNEKQLNKKGIDILIKAFCTIVHKYPHCHLKLGGGGNAVEQLKKEVYANGIEKNVSFLGYLSRKQVADQMKECSAFVLPSRYETFGVVYVEAMACGKPVIGTKTGGPDGFVQEDSGILIDPNDVGQLVYAMEEMIKNFDSYNCDNIRKYVVDNFSMKQIGQKLEEIYISIVGGTK